MYGFSSLPAVFRSLLSTFFGVCFSCGFSSCGMTGGILFVVPVPVVGPIDVVSASCDSSLYR